MARISPFYPMTPTTGAGDAFSRSASALAQAQRADAVSCWTLACGKAMTFKAPAAGSLRVSKGGIWLTFGHVGHIDRNGQVKTPRPRPGLSDDLILQAGQSVLLAAGDSVVFEPFAVADTLDAGLQWRSHAGARDLLHNPGEAVAHDHRPQGVM